MARNNDKVVGSIYETFDYNKFSILAENRGQKETKGINEKKIKKLQKMIDEGTWIPDVARVRCNTNFEIISGANTFEVSRRNGFAIRYEVSDAPHFNEVPKRDLIGNIYLTNTMSTSWNATELFNAALQTRAPLALLMDEFIRVGDNYYAWTDLLALLEKDSNYFIGRWRKANMATFERKDLVELIKSDEFSWEMKHFVKLNLKARIAQKKGILIKAAYDILWYARDMVNPNLFRKALASIPENLVTSQRTTTDEGSRRVLIQHYNKSQGQEVEMATVMFALRHKDKEEPVEL